MSDYVEDWDKAEYRCPECDSTEGFWEEIEVSGWRSVEISYLAEEGIPIIQPLPNPTSMDRDIDWGTARGTGPIGCGECAWEGFEKDLKLHVPPKLGIDGKPLDKPIPGQLHLLA